MTNDEKQAINPHKGLHCSYVYDYCDPENCNCKKSSDWGRKHDPFHDWVDYSIRCIAIEKYLENRFFLPCGTIIFKFIKLDK